MELETRWWVAPAALCCLCLASFQVTEAQPLPRWSDPVPLTEVNTSYHDKSPFLSFDGLTLYLARTDGPGWHYSRLFQARRASLADPFGAPEGISALNSWSGHVDCPWVSPDNRRLYYYRTEVAGKRLKLAERASANALWQPGSNITELNRLGDVANPTLTRDERVIVFGGNMLSGGKGGWDLWIASRADRDLPFENVQNLESLNTDAFDMHPYMTPDGLTLYFGSNRNGTFQLFRAMRTSLDSPFGSPQHLSIFDTPDGDSCYGRLSADGKTLFFARQEENAMYDIYVSHALDTYYVDATGGDDAADGLTRRTALATIQRAIELAQDGDTVNVVSGIYREEVHFLGKAITVQGSGGAAVLETPDRFAVSFYMDEGPDSVLKNFVITNSYVGILISGASPTITNVTVAGNEFGVETYRGGEPEISNSIFWGNSESDLYGCGARYSCIERADLGEGNLSEDPLFVDPDNGDYHLRSERGCYWPEHGVWVLDDVTSPCLDAGDPNADCSQERLPNGGRLNMGAYGGTAFASMSESPFRTDFNGDRAVDANNLELFTDVWEQEVEETASAGR